MHLVVLNYKGNQTKMETLQMETQYAQFLILCALSIKLRIF